ncbi:Sucrose-6-phosphate hydrolase [Streptomyces sp. YIM 130001]|uniref:glycoside hydrolase family 32 protein n=1 Tax=Streptomyces sp. YIM 130001 TaxID=2259644 RepID=UPI000E652104|nr:glycoside hydrolase family 32 protein [Streptomyces sp. YIM 130001]RII20590.1 Sucrose-6-phosphate hydrolase [Streptomyces sp. YIM 130001]
MDDRNITRHHVRPAAGQWCNDPNGPLFHDGRYHLFFQHNPGAPVWGDIHWGHASSPDLVTWTDHGIALAPTPGTRDERGAWSGCAVVEGGVPTAVYTGMDRDDGIGSVMLAPATDDVISSFRAEPAPVVPGPPPGLDLNAFRDPYLFTHEGRRWALIGAGHRVTGAADVLLYRVHSLTDWAYAGSLLDAADPVAARVAAPATVWECPALLPAGDGRWILILSLWIDGITSSTVRLIGDLRTDGDGLRFVPTSGGMLDHGRDFYAPAALIEDDRTLVWGWSWESRSENASVEAGHAGCLTYPREVGLHSDGTVRMAPARELDGLRGTGLAPGDPLPPAYEIQLDVRAEVPDAEVELDLGGTVSLRVNPTRGVLVLDRSGAPATAEARFPRRDRAVASVPGGVTSQLRVLVDGPLIEAFLDERAVITEKVHPAPSGTFTAAVAHGSATVTVSAWSVDGPNPA